MIATLAENEYFFKSYGLTNALVPEILHAQGVTTELKNTVTLTLEKEGTTLLLCSQYTEAWYFNFKITIRYVELIIACVIFES